MDELVSPAKVDYTVKTVLEAPQVSRHCIQVQLAAHAVKLEMAIHLLSEITGFSDTRVCPG
jgi:hypothetical protein